MIHGELADLRGSRNINTSSGTQANVSNTSSLVPTAATTVTFQGQPAYLVTVHGQLADLRASRSAQNEAAQCQPHIKCHACLENTQPHTDVNNTHQSMQFACCLMLEDGSSQGSNGTLATMYTVRPAG
jgi:hypothetical protein